MDKKVAFKNQFCTCLIALSLIICSVILAANSNVYAQTPQFEIKYPEGAHSGPITGRLVLFIAKESKPEPRLRLSPQGPAIYGTDVEQFKPGEVAEIDDDALSHPVELSELEPGEYYIQAVLNVYEKVQRADGHTIWVPFNDGRQAPFVIREGNLYSDVVPVQIGKDGTVKLTLSNVIAQREKQSDTQWVKQVRIQSEMLTEFWGRPVYIHATVLLPKGYAEHPDAHYPVVYTFGHRVPFSFTTDSTQAHNIGQIDPQTGLKTGYDFYQEWNSEGFPRFIAISFQQQTPFFPDSYSINSANNGPYGDAMVEEIVPALERQFRIIPKPYARLVEGASTGGWQALALQLHYPEYYGGAWVFQPDPIDFRNYLLIDIYDDENAFTVPTGPFTSAERPMKRSASGQVVLSIRDISRFEAVIGSHGRSGYQFEGWEAVFGPVGSDGYPKPLWNKLTGKINHEVAQYMRENGYDLRAYAEKNWAEVGPHVQGKLHISTGDMDNFYLNLAVYQFQDFLEATTNPPAKAEFTFGRPLKGHAWHKHTWSELVRRMAAYVHENVPENTDTSSWTY